MKEDKFVPVFTTTSNLPSLLRSAIAKLCISSVSPGGSDDSAQRTFRLPFLTTQDLRVPRDRQIQIAVSINVGDGHLIYGFRQVHRLRLRKFPTALSQINVYGAGNKGAGVALHRGDIQQAVMIEIAEVE
jgi:hypothetical protein